MLYTIIFFWHQQIHKYNLKAYNENRTFQSVIMINSTAESRLNALEINNSFDFPISSLERKIFYSRFHFYNLLFFENRLLLIYVNNIGFV